MCLTLVHILCDIKAILVFEVFTAVVMKSIIFWDMTPCSPLSLTDVSEEHIASIFRVEEIGSANLLAC
jgi:hypothetical protein